MHKSHDALLGLDSRIWLVVQHNDSMNTYEGACHHHLRAFTAAPASLITQYWVST
jgi:hypothetical protein